MTFLLSCSKEAVRTAQSEASGILKLSSTLSWEAILGVIQNFYFKFDVYVTVHHSYNNINNQLDPTIMVFINNSNQRYMFRAMISPETCRADWDY